MKKALVIAITLIMLISTVSYDTYATAIPELFTQYFIGLFKNDNTQTYNNVSYESIITYMIGDVVNPKFLIMAKDTQTNKYILYSFPRSTNIGIYEIEGSIHYYLGNKNRTYLGDIKTLTYDPLNNIFSTGSIGSPYTTVDITKLINGVKTTVLTDIMSQEELPFALAAVNYQIFNPLTQIDNPNEYLYITMPREGYKTIDKFIQYSILYKIKSDAVSDVNISILNQDNESLDSDTKVNKYTITYHDAEINGDYLEGELRILIEYANVTFPVGINVTVKNTVDNRQLTIERNCELVAFIDANNDGIDDNTGQDQYVRPEIPDLDNLSLTDSVEALKNVIPTLTSFIGSIVGLIAIMFGWLPAPVVALMVTIMLIIGITTLLKVLRG